VENNFVLNQISILLMARKQDERHKIKSEIGANYEQRAKQIGQEKAKFIRSPSTGKNSQAVEM